LTEKTTRDVIAKISCRAPASASKLIAYTDTAEESAIKLQKQRPATFAAHLM